MSTNYYWYGGQGDGPDEHIGKRSGGGLYCFKCGVTLCAQGVDGIHDSRSTWHDACPRCGARFKEGDDVKGCCSFRWASDPAEVHARCRAGDLVWDEYGRVMTGMEFLDTVVADCPIRFTDYIGRVFS